MLKDIKQLEIAKEKAIADASVKGKIWNSLGTKKALQEEFKVRLDNYILINLHVCRKNQLYISPSILSLNVDTFLFF